MAFDVSALNQACSAVFCDKAAIWQSPSGNVPLQVALTISPAYDSEGFRIAGETITLDCASDAIGAMKRGETIAAEGVNYNILVAQPDGTGWTNIIVEKQ
jgi:hypothetical protein